MSSSAIFWVLLPLAFTLTACGDSPADRSLDAPDDPTQEQQPPGGGDPSGGNGGQVPPTVPETPSGCRTNGSGGVAADLEYQRFTDSAGRTSEFHVYASKLPPAGPVGLMLYTHGDGAEEIEDPEWKLHKYAGIAAENGMMLVAMLAPNANNVWWQQGIANAAWARELVQKELYTKYDISRSRVLLVGFSGGADFVTEFFVPQQSDVVCGGGALIFGGGSPPDDDDIKPFAPGFISAFKMHFFTGLDDTGSPSSCSSYNALASAKKSFALYQQLGFPVTAEHRPGIGHCNIPFEEVLSDQLAKGIVAPSR